MSASSPLSELRDLRIEVAKLRERNEQLEAELAYHGAREADPEQEPLFSTSWRLTQTERRILRVLMENGFVSKERMMDAVYFDRFVDDQPHVKILDVYICKLRKKLAPHGIEIETVWGDGYRVMPDSRSRLRAAA